MSKRKLIAAAICSLALTVLLPNGVNASDDADVNNQEQVAPDVQQSEMDVEEQNGNEAPEATFFMWGDREVEETDVPELPASEYDKKIDADDSMDNKDLQEHKKELLNDQNIELRVNESMGPAPEVIIDDEAQKPVIEADVEGNQTY